MYEIKLYPYVLLGDSIRVLRNVEPGMPIGEPIGQGELSLYDHLVETYDKLLRMGLTVTFAAYQDKFKDIIEDTANTIETQGEFVPLPEELATEILTGMTIVTEILKYESEKLQAYIVTEKRLPVNKLLSNIGGLFGEYVYNALPELSRYDFTQAGKCIAFELPTSAAFHILRATENILRSYHSALVVCQG